MSVMMVVIATARNLRLEERVELDESADQRGYVE